MITHFVNVDDDQINNMLCEMTIKNYLPNAYVKAFSDPQQALEYIKITYTYESPLTLLFLDINMPAFNGWEFLEEFETFPCYIKEKIKICMLSSSVDARDKERACNNKNVMEYIEKPLTKQAIKIATSKVTVEIKS